MTKYREVYVGNGVTLTVKIREKEIWVYDYDKINELLQRYGTIEVGMRDDWYWTATDIFKPFPSNKEFDKIVKKIPLPPKEVKDYKTGPFISENKLRTLAPLKVYKAYLSYKKKMRLWKQKIKPFLIVGIYGSDWDTPIAQTSDGEVEIYRVMKIIEHPEEGFWSLEERC